MNYNLRSNPITLTENRKNTILENAKKHLKGKLSYLDALEESKQEGAFSRLGNFFAPDEKLISQKQQAIEKQFNQSLYDCQIEQSNAILKEFATPLPENSTLSAIHQHYQAIFHRLEVESSEKKYQLIDVQYNNNTTQMIFKFQAKDKSNNRQGAISVQSIQLSTKQASTQKNQIIAEYLIYKHSKYGDDISNQREYVPYNQNGTSIIDSLISDYQDNFSSKQNYDGICFSGGGAKGAVCPAALEVLGEHRLKKIKQVSGASAGALTAGLVACGIKPYEFTEFVGRQNLKVDQKQLQEIMRSRILATIRARVGELNMKSLNSTKKSIAKKFFYLANNYDITFSDLDQLSENFPELGFKKIFISAHAENTNKLGGELILSADNCPYMPLSLGCVVSVALPIVYDKVDISTHLSENYKHELGIKNGEKVLADDGGMVNNLPVNYLLKLENPRILVLSFEGNYQKYQKGSVGLVGMVANTMFSTPVMSYKFADINFIDQHCKSSSYHLQHKGISTIDFELATRKFMQLQEEVKKDFLKKIFDISKINSNNSLRSKFDEVYEVHEMFKFSVSPRYYEGSSEERQVFDKCYKKENNTPVSYIDYLKNATNKADFDKCYDDYEQKLKQHEENLAKERALKHRYGKI